MRRLNLSESILHESYLVENKSTVQIAKELNVSDRTVTRYLKQYNIKLRNKSDANKLAGSRISKSLKNYFDSMTKDERIKKCSTSVKGENNPCYKPINHFYFSKYNKYKLIKIGNKKWESEHRLNVEKYLGRKLIKGECVHHINENRIDNRLSNLYLFKNRGLHTAFTMLVKNKIIKLDSLKSNLRRLKKGE